MLNDAVLAVLWAVVLWRVPTLWQARWKRSPWIALAALAIALTLDLPASITAIDHSTGIVDLATLGKHVSGIIASAAVLDWVAALQSADRTPRLRVHRVAAAAAIAAMTVLFAVMPRTETADFTPTVSGGLPAAYLLVFYSYLGAAMGGAAVLFWGASRLPPRGTVRWGFWLLAAGTSTGACYATFQAACLILRVLGAVGAADAQMLIHSGGDIEDIAILLILAGLSVPAFGVAGQNARDLAALRALRGLWRDLAAAVPEVTAGSWRNVVSGSAGAPRILLIRRTAEIRDAALALRCYVQPGQVADARRRLSGEGLSGTALDAAAEACWLNLAIAAVTAGGPADKPAHVLPGGQTLSDEVRWLRQVAAARQAGPVQRVTAQAADGSPTHPEGTPR
jgi:hypothetical protein